MAQSSAHLFTTPLHAVPSVPDGSQGGGRPRPGRSPTTRGGSGSRTPPWSQVDTALSHVQAVVEARSPSSARSRPSWGRGRRGRRVGARLRGPRGPVPRGDPGLPAGHRREEGPTALVAALAYPATLPTAPAPRKRSGGRARGARLSLEVVQDTRPWRPRAARSSTSTDPTRTAPSRGCWRRRTERTRTPGHGTTRTPRCLTPPGDDPATGPAHAGPRSRILVEDHPRRVLTPTAIAACSPGGGAVLVLQLLGISCPARPRPGGWSPLSC
ncbi:hypothetical protein QJS66_21940 [Kocuria rhizophila]|nr:hypothetical protein QJS66_21940 [Kocuria rhizophila]